MIVVLMGLPGTGKSRLARELSSRYGWRVIDRDQVRNALFAAEELDYGVEQNQFASRIALGLARWLLGRDPDRTVVFDGRPFSQSEQRSEVRRLASELGQPMRFVLCRASRRLIAERLARDAEEGGDPRARRTMSKVSEIARHFEPVTEPHLVLDTAAPPVELAAEVRRYVEAGAG